MLVSRNNNIIGMSENMYLGIFYIYSVFHIPCVVPGTGSAATYVVQKETKPRDFPPRRTTLVSGFQHWRLWWENYGTAEIGGRLVLVWWPFGCGQPIVMNGHFGLD